MGSKGTPGEALLVPAPRGRSPDSFLSDNLSSSRCGHPAADQETQRLLPLAPDGIRRERSSRGFKRRKTCLLQRVSVCSCSAERSLHSPSYATIDIALELHDRVTPLTGNAWSGAQPRVTSGGRSNEGKSAAAFQLIKDTNRRNHMLDVKRSALNDGALSSGVRRVRLSRRGVGRASGSAPQIEG